MAVIFHLKQTDRDSLFHQYYCTLEFHTILQAKVSHLEASELFMAVFSHEDLFSFFSPSLYSTSQYAFSTIQPFDPSYAQFLSSSVPLSASTPLSSL